MELPVAYIPIDRCLALIQAESLPDRTTGAALFADISGFTALTEALVKELGSRRGADELSQHLNAVYEGLIQEIHRYRGSVIIFSGDAVTCWFDGDNGLRAIASGLAIQQVIQSFAAIKTPGNVSIPIAIKVAVTSGPIRRFQIGDPQIQIMDALAGATMARLAELEHHAEKGEVVVGTEVIAHLEDWVQVTEWRGEAEAKPELAKGKKKRKPAIDRAKKGDIAVVANLTTPVEATPWPAITVSEQIGNPLWRSWLLPPIYQRLQSGQGQFLAEIRLATALFLQFTGIDYDHDDDAGLKLDRYIRWAQNVLVRHESYLLQLTIGDKGCYLYAAFGAPLAHDDDMARAVAAALELRSPPPELSFITQIKIGLNQGRMRAGAYGGSTRRTYGVLGDEVNLAARLMQAAEPGQILVSQRIAQTVAAQYRLEYLPPLKVKGKQEAVVAARILGRRFVTPQRPLFTFSLPPLVGRKSELARLVQGLQTVQMGQGQVICLAGPSGIGKSRLAAELVEEAISLGFQVALGACHSADREVIYYPWRHIFRTLFELTDEPLAGEEPTTWHHRQISQIEAMLLDINPNWLALLPLLGDLLGLTIPDNSTTSAFEPQLRQEALFALATDLLLAWTEGGYPSLLLIEDAHWLDEASQHLTLALARVMTNKPLALILVQRLPTSEEKSVLTDLNWLPHYQQLNLGELSPASLAELVAQRLRGPIETLPLALIQLRTQGNPFYIEEVVHTLLEVGALTQRSNGVWRLTEATFNILQAAQCLTKDSSSGEWTLAAHALLPTDALQLPDTIYSLVLARFDRLLESHKVTLKVASVIGATFEFEALTRAHLLQPDRTTLLAQVRTLEARDFIRQETPPPRLTYMFKHNITREVVYEALLEEQRQALHQAVAETLEGLHPEAVEQLAYHYSRSKVRDKTFFYLDQAAHKVQREYANETALNYYRQALALEERWSWRQGEVEVLHILGEREAERASLEILETTLSTGAEEQRSKYAKHDLHLSPFRLPPSGMVAYLWGQYYEAISNYAEAQAAIEQALAASRAQRNLVSEVHCLAQLGLIARRQGDYKGAKAWYNQALNLFQTNETYPDGAMQAFAEALNGLGTVHRQQGEFDQARICYQRALAMSRMSGDQRDEAQALNNFGVIAYYQRQLAEAQAYHRQALAIRHNIGDRAGEGTSLLNLSQVTGDLGDYSQAQQYLYQALVIQQATGNRWEEINVWNGLGVRYQELGDLVTAEACLQRGLTLSQEIGDEAGQAFILCNLALVRYDRGDLTTAEKLLTDGLALAQMQADKDLESSFLSYLSIVSLQAKHIPQAIEQAQAALTMRRELNLHLRTTDDLATLAAAYLAAGNMANALDYVQQTLAILEECNGEGPEFPAQDYFICYQVCRAAGQMEQAQAALQSAYQLVMARADKILDPALRLSFLEQVAINQEIVAEYERRGEVTSGGEEV